MRPIQDAYWVIPGRLLAGEYPTVTFNPEANERRLGAFLGYGFDTFINLTSLGEAEDYSPLLCKLAQARSQTVNCLRFPVNDYGLPAQHEMTNILDAMDGALETGHRVYLHCYGGIGRTGTVMGCYLVRHGLSGSQALEQLAAWWLGVPKSKRFPNSPETLDQEKFILNWQEPKK
jgi:hypothetical protein